MNPIFGRPGATLQCEGAPLAQTPVGEPCGGCEVPIEEGDSGTLIACVMPGSNKIKVFPWHVECQLRDTTGSLAHIRALRARMAGQPVDETDVCATGHRGAVNAARTPQERRKEALAVWHMLIGAGAPQDARED